MKTLKLVLGILCMVLTVFIILQSCAAGVANAIEEGVNGGESDHSDIAGIFVALLMLAGGITMVATRNSVSKSGSIACVVIFALAAIIGFSGAGIFKDLIIWSSLCLIIAAINVFAIIILRKEALKSAEVTENKE